MERIEYAYSFASRILLDLLMTEMQLRKRLRSLKDYFLLTNGDFFIHFMNVAEGELRKNITDILPSRLESLMVRLRACACSNDMSS